MTHTYLLILATPVLAGLITGIYTKGPTINKGKTAFIGVLVGTLIVSLFSLLSLHTLMPELMVSIWAESPTIAIALVLSPIICGVLGLVGGLMSEKVAKLIQYLKTAKLKD